MCTAMVLMTVVAMVPPVSGWHGFHCQWVPWFNHQWVHGSSCLWVQLFLLLISVMTPPASGCHVSSTGECNGSSCWWMAWFPPANPYSTTVFCNDVGAERRNQRPQPWFLLLVGARVPLTLCAMFGHAGGFHGSFISGGHSDTFKSLEKQNSRSFKSEV